jgi:hypothetical protein
MLNSDARRQCTGIGSQTTKQTCKGHRGELAFGGERKQAAATDAKKQKEKGVTEKKKMIERARKQYGKKKEKEKKKRCQKNAGEGIG